MLPNNIRGLEREIHPSPLDMHVGSRIRLRRTVLGVSQEGLSDALGLSCKQVQKYESGVNRVGAPRLFDISQALGVSISFFFEDMPDEINAPSASSSYGFAKARELCAKGFDAKLSEHETKELVRTYYEIIEPTVRKRVFDLIKILAHLR